MNIRDKLALIPAAVIFYIGIAYKTEELSFTYIASGVIIAFCTWGLFSFLFDAIWFIFGGLSTLVRKVWKSISNQ